MLLSHNIVFLQLIACYCYFQLCHAISSPNPYLKKQHAISATLLFHPPNSTWKQRAISAIMLFHPLFPTQKQHAISVISSLTPAMSQKQRAIFAITLFHPLTPISRNSALFLLLIYYFIPNSYTLKKWAISVIMLFHP